MKELTFIPHVGTLFIAMLLSACGSDNENGDRDKRKTTAEAIATITDSNFANCLHNSLTETYVDEVTEISCSGHSIHSVQGVSAFSGLTMLNLKDNELHNVDLSKNTALTTIDLGNNQLTKIDLRYNTVLTALSLANNNFINIPTGIDKIVDTSATINLMGNRFNNAAMASLEALKKTYTNLSYLKTTAEVINEITDPNLQRCLRRSLTEVYANQVTRINCSSVGNTDGISNFTALTELYLGVGWFAEIDLSKNTALSVLSLDSSQLTSVNLNKNTELTKLYLDKVQFTEIDLSKNTALTTLHIQEVQLTEIDLSNNTALATLYIQGKHLTEIDLSKNTVLTTLQLSWVPLTEIDLRQNTALTRLHPDGHSID